MTLFSAGCPLGAFVVLRWMANMLQGSPGASLLHWTLAVAISNNTIVRRSTKPPLWLLCRLKCKLDKFLIHSSDYRTARWIPPIGYTTHDNLLCMTTWTRDELKTTTVTASITKTANDLSIYLCSTSDSLTYHVGSVWQLPWELCNNVQRSLVVQCLSWVKSEWLLLRRATDNIRWWY